MKVALRHYRRSRCLKFRYHRLTSWKTYFGVYILILSIYLFQGFIAWWWYDTYRKDLDMLCLRNYVHACRYGFSKSYEDYLKQLYYGNILEAAVFTIIILVAIIGLILLLRLICWGVNKMVP